MNKVKNRQGFTLIELIISISILGIITGLFLADYKSSNQRAVLNAAADQLAGDLRLAQSYALGAKKNEKNGNTVPAGGWGIWLRSQPPNNVYYVLFADSNLSGGGDTPQKYDSSDGQYRTIDFPAGNNGKALVVVDSMSGFANPQNDNSVVFLPPDPDVYFDGAKADNSIGQIILKDTSTGDKKKVIINSFGLIDVEDAQ